MTVSEFIKLWDSINISTIPFVYYYTGIKTLKHKLYDINDEINTIKIKCCEESLQEYDVSIYHKYLEWFNYDQQEFYDNLTVEIPDTAHVNVIQMYIN